MESNEEVSCEKEQDNEMNSLKKMEIIQFYNYNPNYIYKNSRKNKCLISFFVIALLIIIIFICTFFFIYGAENNNFQIATYQNKLETKNKIEQNKFASVKNEAIFQPKGANVQTKEVKPQPTPVTDVPKIIPKKPGIAFVYPEITEFMITTGEYLLKLNKYSIFFITKINATNKIIYSKNITRINSYFEHPLIEKEVKNENIQYLIINDFYSKKELSWISTLGVKIIGVFDDIYTIKTEKYNRYLQNIFLYNAFIQDSLQDYTTFKNIKSDKNILIPNIYDSRKTKLSSLNNHNIIILGKLNHNKNGIVSAITAMASIVKEFPDIKLNIISPDGPTLTINQLIKKFGLNKNIVFLSFDTKISNYFIDSSIFIYASLIEECSTAIKEAMNHGLPCIVSTDIANNLLSQDGIIKVNITKEKDLANEIIKLLKDNKYKNKIGMGARSSLEKINDDAVNLWDRLLISLKTGEKDFQKLRTEIENKYTIKEIPKSTIIEAKATNLPKQTEVINIPKKSKVTNIPKQTKVTNIPKQTKVTKTNKQTKATNLPKKTKVTNLPKQTKVTTPVKKNVAQGSKTLISGKKTVKESKTHKLIDKKKLSLIANKKSQVGKKGVKKDIKKGKKQTKVKKLKMY